jgi:hypothetical protein
MQVDDQKYYWLFSSSSQTIAAFIAFLVTGFAVVLNMMDTLQQKDETLAEIHGQIKADYYKKIFFLAVISGISILGSLLMIYLNGTAWRYKSVLYIITAGLNVIAIWLAILFIISIINPNKYNIAAKEIIEEDKSEFAPKDNNVAQVYFMNEFADLERKLYKILKVHGFATRDEADKKIPFREVVTALFDHELISREELYELLQINKYRNLVFHGHLETVSEGMLDRIRSICRHLDGIINEFGKQTG